MISTFLMMLFLRQATDILSKFSSRVVIPFHTNPFMFSSYCIPSAQIHSIFFLYNGITCMLPKRRNLLQLHFRYNKVRPLSLSLGAESAGLYFCFCTILILLFAAGCLTNACCISILISVGSSCRSNSSCD